MSSTLCVHPDMVQKGRISASSAQNSSSKLKKRNNVCPYSKRSLLSKRNEACPCAVARATFSNKVTGFIFLSQNQCDSTTFVGQFSSGFRQGCDYSFLITDDCGNIIKNITQQLDVQFNNNGGSEAFHARIDDISINCDNNGILNSAQSFSSKRKRTCKKAGKSLIRINEDEKHFDDAKIELLK
ncbi:7838_t:CDS:2 [Entrophospora sp. SA101]|nr:10667_t:CDS:2 [Entrophospora sp. SA101]CAJ0627364.1 7838_t:CDS:2 [Entrophospora sp. SA101]CAJ0824174.1 10810_t:CDS:2 [Entrophospora sp. SA101]CAJ0908105.1 10975_t:CDS:2 [Entrophospora sp. SA101]CAJ0910059.1 16816_t:CDS:2 [Entrophospora sp. SA101]